MGVLTIFHTNDLHNHWGALRLLERQDRNGALLLDSGDAIAGSNTLFFPREPILAQMSRLGYAAMAMGNREFHYLRNVLRSRARDAAFPILSANVKDLSGNLKEAWLPWTISYCQGLRIGILGLTPVQYPESSILTRITGLTFLQPNEAACIAVEELRPQAHLLIALSHLGWKADVELAMAVPDLALIVGGHSHTALREPLLIGKTLIIQAGSHGRLLGMLKAEFAGGNRLEPREYKLLSAEHDGGGRKA